jgi:hypothetical protein
MGSGYPSNVEGFVRYKFVALYQLAGFFMVKVSPLTGDFLVKLRHPFTSLAAATRTLLSSTKYLLGPSELLLGLTVVARRLHDIAVASDQEGFEAEVNAYGRTISGSLRGIPEIAGEVGSSEEGVCLAGILECGALLTVGDGPLLSLEDISMLREGLVVEPTMGLEHPLQSRRLRAVGIKAVLDSLPHRRTIRGAGVSQNRRSPRVLGGVRGLRHRRLKTSVPAA